VENGSISLQEKGRFLYKELHGLVICVLSRANSLSFVGSAFSLPITYQDERFQRTGLSVTVERSGGFRTSSVPDRVQMVLHRSYGYGTAPWWLTAWAVTFCLRIGRTLNPYQRIPPNNPRIQVNHATQEKKSIPAIILQLKKSLKSNSCRRENDRC